jgi:multidrug resistance efflux pump
MGKPAECAASTPVFAQVSTRDVWIEANFKEVQLTRMLPGQAATVDTQSADPKLAVVTGPTSAGSVPR